MTYRMAGIVFLAFALVASVCCDGNSTKPRPEPGWYSLGLEEKSVGSVELDYPYLYVCARDDGLFRARVNKRSPSWEYLGLAGSAFPQGASGTLRDVLVLDDAFILAASSYNRSNLNYPGIHRSDGEDFTWTPSDSGMRLSKYSSCRATALAGCDHYTFAGTVGCGTYRSDDAGQYWELVDGCKGCGYTLDWIEQSPSDCSILWHAGGAADESYMMFVSDDHGATWDWVHPSSAFLDRYVIALPPTEPRVAYVGIRGAVVRTADLGSSFETVMELPERAWPMALAHGLSPGHLFVAYISEGESPSLYETRDGGASVDTLTTPTSSTIRDLYHDPIRQAMYAGTDNGVYKYVY